MKAIVWYETIATFLGSLVSALCMWLWYRAEGGNEAFYGAISASVIAALAGLGMIVEYFFTKVDGTKEKPGSKEAIAKDVAGLLGAPSVGSTTISHGSVGGIQREVCQPGVLAAAMAAKIVEEGMPSAEAIARYLIANIDTLDCNDVYTGLDGKIRNGIRDIVIYNEDPDAVIDNIIKSFPVGGRPRKATTIRHVTIGRRAFFKLRVDSFIRQLELVVSELVGFQEQALPAPSPSADRETPNEPVSS